MIERLKKEYKKGKQLTGIYQGGRKIKMAGKEQVDGGIQKRQIDKVVYQKEERKRKTESLLHYSFCFSVFCMSISIWAFPGTSWFLFCLVIIQFWMPGWSPSWTGVLEILVQLYQTSGWGLLRRFLTLMNVFYNIIFF